MTGGWANFYVGVKMSKGLEISGGNLRIGSGASIVTGSRGSEKTALTGKMTFSDQSWMKYSNGLLVDYEIKSASS